MLRIVRLIQRLIAVNVLASAAVREASAAERFRRGFGSFRYRFDSDLQRAKTGKSTRIRFNEDAEKILRTRPSQRPLSRICRVCGPATGRRNSGNGAPAPIFKGWSKQNFAFLSSIKSSNIVRRFALCFAVVHCVADSVYRIGNK